MARLVGGVAADVLQLDGLFEERLGVREAPVVGESARVCVKRDGAARGGVAAGVLEVDDLLEERLGIGEAEVAGEGPSVCVKCDRAAGGGVAAGVLQFDGQPKVRLGVGEAALETDHKSRGIVVFAAHKHGGRGARRLGGERVKLASSAGDLSVEKESLCSVDPTQKRAPFVAPSQAKPSRAAHQQGRAKCLAAASASAGFACF